jgi:hypothetical protein
MPAPRTTSEVVYSSIIFLIDQNPSSIWLRRYFTLELSVDAHWVLAEWDTSQHLNYGQFPLASTLSNFLSKIIDTAKSDWC